MVYEMNNDGCTKTEHSALNCTKFWERLGQQGNF